MNRIQSFCVDHDYIREGLYISRIDGEIITYDMRTRIPNAGDYMDNVTMHSVEHMLATFVRNSEIGQNVIYFGPMGCRTGFYLLVQKEAPERVLAVLRDCLQKTVDHTGEMFGQSRKECGNYRELSLEAAKTEAARYLRALDVYGEIDFTYPKGEEA